MSRFRRTESGAMAIIIALVTCFVVIPLGTLAVDLGMQRVSRVDMQSVADTAAIDLARLINGGPASGYSSSTLLAAANASAGRDANWVGSTPTMGVYLVTAASTTTSDQSNFCSGSANAGDGYTLATGSTVPTAIVVTATSSVSFAIHGGAGAVCRSAVGAAFKNACFSVDSYAAQLATGNSAVLGPLTSMLGSNFSATLLGSSGLATTSVSLLSFLQILQANVGVGSVNQVLTTNVTATQFLTAEEQALTQSGTTSSTALTAFNNQLIANLGPLASKPIQVGQLLNLSQGGASALGASVNALDLAMGAIYLANGTNAIALSVSTPPSISGISASASLIQKPQIACGQPGVSATTSQASINLTANLMSANSLTSNLLTGLNNLLSSVLGLLLGGHSLSVTVGAITGSVSLAQASGTLSSVSCSGANATGMAIAESSSLAPVTLSLPITITDTYTPPLGIGPKTVSTATVTTTVTTNPVQPSSTTGTFSLPADYNVPKAGPSGNLSLSNLTVTTTVKNSDPNNIITSDFSSIANLGGNILGSLTSTLLGNILGPVLTNAASSLQSWLGLTLAGSTFTALPPASCGVPKLIG